MLQNYNHELSSRAGKLIKSLKGMELRDDGSSRAGLSALRVGLRARDGVCVETMPHVAAYLAEFERPQEDRWFFAVATLFALHPQDQAQRESLGGAFARLRQNSDSIEKRFQLLLSCSGDDLFEQLKQIVSLLKANNIPINWWCLLNDLTQHDWDDPEREIQLSWARDFYKTAASKAPQPD